MSENKTVLDITQSYDAKKFGDLDFIQKNAKDKFNDLLKNFLKEAINYKKMTKDDEIKRVHNTILIDGERGTGKTSFILSMKEFLKKDYSSMEFLKIIDPTLIETKENVFITVLATIKELVDKKLKDSDYAYSDKCHKWEKSLKNLATGLSLLDGVGSEHMKQPLWDDPAQILEEGLKDAKQGSNLEKDFHCFLKESLNVLEKDAFILPFDDIDTSADRGKPILEIIRKYFTSPSLIVVLLGDMKIYSLIAREIQWEKMNPEKTKKYECWCKDSNVDSHNKYINELDTLSEQYLLKILKPENRIHLEEIKKIKSIFVKTSKGEKVLKDYLKEIVIDLFMAKRKIDRFTSLFLELTIRQLLQFLRMYHEWSNPNNQTKVENKFSNLRNVFSEVILSYKNADSLLNSILDKEENSINKLAVFFLENNFLDNEFKLNPQYSDQKKNILLTTLNAFVSIDLRSNPNKIFDYFIKIGVTRYAINSVVPNHIEINEESREKEYKKIATYLGLDSKDNCYKVSKKLTSLLNPENNQTSMNRVSRGTIFYNYENNKDILLSYINNSLNNQNRYVSFYTFLALVSYKIGSHIDDSELSQATIYENFYHTKSNIYSESQKYNDSKEFIIKKAEESIIKEFKNLHIDITQLANTIYRFISNINVLDLKEDKTYQFYEIFKLYKEIFLNSLLVEEFRNKENINLMYGFMHSSGKKSVFEQNKEKIKTIEENTLYSLMEQLVNETFEELIDESKDNFTLEYKSSNPITKKLNRKTFPQNKADIKKIEESLSYEEVKTFEEFKEKKDFDDKLAEKILYFPSLYNKFLITNRPESRKNLWKLTR